MKINKKAIIAAVLCVSMMGFAGCSSNNGGNSAGSQKQEEKAKGIKSSAAPTDVESEEGDTLGE